jgi:hypothetical protein
MTKVIHPGLSLFDCKLKTHKSVIDYSAWRTHMKILIIEDDENMVDYIRNVLMSVA